MLFLLTTCVLDGALTQTRVQDSSKLCKWKEKRETMQNCNHQTKGTYTLSKEALKEPDAHEACT